MLSIIYNDGLPGFSSLGFPDPTLGTAVLEITDFRRPFAFVRLDHSNLPFINPPCLVDLKGNVGSFIILYDIIWSLAGSL